MGLLLKVSPSITTLNTPSHSLSRSEELLGGREEGGKHDMRQKKAWRTTEVRPARKKKRAKILKATPLPSSQGAQEGKMDRLQRGVDKTEHENL